MSMNLGDTAQQAATNGIVDLIDVGGAGTLRFYTGAKNANGNTEPSGAVCDLTFSATAFGAADADGIATANAIASGVATGAGTIQSAAYISGGGTVIAQVDVSTIVAGTGDIQLSSTTVAISDTVSLSSLTFTAPVAQA